jgi:glutamine synthetase adenylyltransferase
VRLGKKLIAALAEITEDGYTFRVDMALRPTATPARWRPAWAWWNAT